MRRRCRPRCGSCRSPASSSMPQTWPTAAASAFKWGSRSGFFLRLEVPAAVILDAAEPLQDGLMPAAAVRVTPSGGVH